MRLPWVREFYGLFGCCLAGLALGLLLPRILRYPGIWSAGMCLAGLSLVLGLLFIVFFRDPERSSDALPEKILSPADGRVMAVEEVLEMKYFKGPARRIAIFMHVGNVHVQRLPADGHLVWSHWQAGEFLPAFKKEAAGANEQRWYAFEGSGRKFAVVQIAGLLARRTISWLAEGQACSRGQRLGMIAFGSEVDVYLPVTVKTIVAVGEKVRAGKTAIGVWNP